MAEALVDPQELDCGPNFNLLLCRTRAALAAKSNLPLLSVSNDHVALLEPNIESDWAEFKRAVERARSTDDQFAAGTAWRDALQIAEQCVLSDIDHPLILPIKGRITGVVLEALEGLACGPFGRQQASLIVERLREFQLERATGSIETERLMRLYAALGMKDELARAFSEFETYLDDEHGEGVPSKHSALFESLMVALDRPQSNHCGVAPARPLHTMGRDRYLSDLVDRLTKPSAAEFTTVTGQSGVGKSQLLRELFWRLASQRVVGYFDLESQPQDLVSSILRDRPCEVILLDHVLESHRSFVGELVASYGGSHFLCASNSRLHLPEESIVLVKPLEIGDHEEPGPAIELLMHDMRLVHSAEDREPTSADVGLLIEVAQQCDGIPLALEIAARLCGSTSISATLGSLRRSLDGLTDNRQEPRRRSSLRSAIESSFANLGPEARRLVCLLSNLKGSCHIDQFLECCDSLPCDLEEAILAGLISREPNSSYVRVLHSTATAVDALVESATQEIITYGDRAADWFERKAREVPLDLDIAGALPTSLSMIVDVFERSEPNTAMRLCAAIKPWLGSWQLAPSDLQRIDMKLMDRSNIQDANWASAVLSLSAAYCHAGEFKRMSGTTSAALEISTNAAMPAEIRCQMHMQFGIAMRALERFDEAIEAYQLAIKLVDESVAEWTLVKCYYNLGVLLETQERLEEALVAQEAAADHFSETTDPRVESLVSTCIGRLRFRLGSDLVSAGLVLEATLAHARARQDKRSVAEILQNLGLIYLERQLYAEAALVEAVGTLLLLDFGYSGEFRRLAKSSFVTLGTSLLGLDFHDLAIKTRTLIDRLGPAALYPPNQVLFETLAAKTYTHPTGLKFATAAEVEVRGHLRCCIEHLHAIGTCNEESLSLFGVTRSGDERVSRSGSNRV
ncbi:MAG: ATP-binding protein [Methanoregulaceae archaeon]|nr:ATP-binding protein [Methanoregulaceae archaeon]